MIYVFDLDGTLCETLEGDYGKAVPKHDRIEHVNDLCREGHTIVVSTARGEMWKEFTRQQLLRWGVQFHVLSVGAKPYGDLYVDDRAINANEFFGGVN
tara:strand:- start:873 stop:1166 length:294 start_codon:yes stop_codon:yes gene_type:complete